MIRGAKVADQHITVLLIHQAIDDLVHIFTGSWEMKVALGTMTKMFNVPETRFSKEYSSIIEKQGVVVGQIMAYPAVKMARLNEGLIKVLRDNYKGPIDELRLIERQILQSKEAFDGEYYIDNLAVMPAFRGQGIARELIEHVEKKAKSQGYDKLSLLAEESNEKAFNVYKKLGFITDCDLDVLGHKFKHMVKKV